MAIITLQTDADGHSTAPRYYIIGALELQLLYVPKPNGATDEEMPKSMGSAIREMNRAHEITEVNFEGSLSQQGGDCQVSIFV